MKSTEIVTIVIALWGAILSTLLGIHEIRKSSRRIKIICKYVPWNPFDIERDLFLVKIVNIGSRPVSIDKISFVFPEGRRASSDELQFHHPKQNSKILEHDYYEIIYPLEDGPTKQSFLYPPPMRIEVVDTEQKIYKSRVSRKVQAKLKRHFEGSPDR